MEGRALGKGLSALIPDKVKKEGETTIAYLKTAEINNNPYQPRSEFDESKLSDLVASIKEKGVLQPILVRKKDNKFEVVAGERRLRAARALDLKEVPVVIKEVSDKEALVIALVENIQREELNAIEEAHAYHRLISDFDFSQESVAQSVGKDRTTISNLIRLLKLPEEIQKSLSSNIISVGHARSLLSIDNENKQRRIYKKTIKGGLSVRALENLIKRELLGVKAKTKSGRDPYVTAMEEELQRVLGTKVRIMTKKKQGNVVIEFYSPTDLERIMEIIKK